MRAPKRIKVIIEEVNLNAKPFPLAQGRVIGTNGLIDIDLGEAIGGNFTMPRVGERWWIQKLGMVWSLLQRVDRGRAGSGGAGDNINRPGAPANVDMGFTVREYKTHLEYQAFATFDEVTEDAQGDAFTASHYIIQWMPTDKEGDLLSGEKPRQLVWNPSDQAIDAIDDPGNDYYATLPGNIENPKKWYWTVRVRAVSVDNVKGPWSGWTDPALPIRKSQPTPPPPANVSLVFKPRELKTHLEYRANVTFDDVGWWDIPGYDYEDDISEYQVQLQPLLRDDDAGTIIPGPKNDFEAAQGVAGNVNVGVHEYVIVADYSGDYVLISNPISVDVLTSASQVNLTNIPIADTGIGRRIYRTVAAGSVFKYVATINDVDTSYTDNLADAGLGALITYMKFTPVDTDHQHIKRQTVKDKDDKIDIDETTGKQTDKAVVWDTLGILAGNITDNQTSITVTESQTPAGTPFKIKIGNEVMVVEERTANGGNWDYTVYRGFEGSEPDLNEILQFAHSNGATVELYTGSFRYSVSFDHIEFARKWYWRAGVRSKDRFGRWGNWNQTLPTLASLLTEDTPPYPTNVYTDIELVKHRTHPEYRVVCKFTDPAPNGFDIPGGDREDDLSHYIVQAQALLQDDTNGYFKNLLIEGSDQHNYKHPETVLGTLNGGIDDAVTSLTASPTATYPKLPFKIRVDTASNVELMEVTGRTGDVLTVERGKEGTTAVNHTTGVAIAVVKPHIRRKVVRDKDQKGTEHYKVPFEEIPHSHSGLTETANLWYWRTRVCSVDRFNRRSLWGPVGDADDGWTDLNSPANDADLIIDTPTGLTLSFARLNKHRHGLPAIVATWNELTYTAPDGDKENDVASYGVQVSTHDGAVLTGGINNSVETITVTEVYQQQTVFPFDIQIDDEIMTVVGRVANGGDWDYDVTGGRGAYGSTAASHSGAAKIWQYPPASKQVSAKHDDDANTICKTTFPGAKKGYLYRARIRARDRYNRLSAWSAWTAEADPNDTTPPPPPTNPSVEVIPHHVLFEWDPPTEPSDTDPDLATISTDVAYFQVQLATDAGFSNILKSVRYTTDHHFKFRVRRTDDIYWCRVRSVDGSGNKSAWVSASGSIVGPTVADTVQIEFHRSGGNRYGRFGAKVTWDEITSTDYTLADIDRYIVHLQNGLLFGELIDDIATPFDTAYINHDGIDIPNLPASISVDEETLEIDVPPQTTAAVGAAGTLSGVYVYKVVAITPSDTIYMGDSNSVSPSSQQVDLSSIPLGPTGTTARKIYRTLAGGSAYYRVGTIGDNSTTIYTDNLADATIQADIEAGSPTYEALDFDSAKYSITTRGFDNTVATGHTAGASVYYKITDSVQKTDAKDGATANDRNQVLFKNIAKYGMYRAKVCGVTRGNIKGAFRYTAWLPTTDNIAPPIPTDLGGDVDQDKIILVWNLEGEQRRKIISSDYAPGSTVIVFTTRGTHPFLVGDEVELNVFGNSEYNGVFEVTDKPSSTSFEVDFGEDPGDPESYGYVYQYIDDSDVAYYQIQISNKANKWRGNYFKQDRYVTSHTKTFKLKKPRRWVNAGGGDGDIHARVRAVDSSGNTSAWLGATVTINDNWPNPPRISSFYVDGDDVDGDSTVTIEWEQTVFDGDDIATYEVQLQMARTHRLGQVLGSGTTPTDVPYLGSKAWPNAAGPGTGGAGYPFTIWIDDEQITASHMDATNKLINISARAQGGTSTDSHANGSVIHHFNQGSIVLKAKVDGNLGDTGIDARDDDEPGPTVLDFGSHTFDGKMLKIGRWYRARVRAISSNGKISDWSFDEATNTGPGWTNPRRIKTGTSIVYELNTGEAAPTATNLSLDWEKKYTPGESYITKRRGLAYNPEGYGVLTVSFASGATWDTGDSTQLKWMGTGDTSVTAITWDALDGAADEAARVAIVQACVDSITVSGSYSLGTFVTAREVTANEEYELVFDTLNVGAMEMASWSGFTPRNDGFYTNGVKYTPRPTFITCDGYYTGTIEQWYVCEWLASDPTQLVHTYAINSNVYPTGIAYYTNTADPYDKTWHYVVGKPSGGAGNWYVYKYQARTGTFGSTKNVDSRLRANSGAACLDVDNTQVVLATAEALSTDTKIELIRYDINTSGGELTYASSVSLNKDPGTDFDSTKNNVTSLCKANPGSGTKHWYAGLGKKNASTGTLNYIRANVTGTYAIATAEQFTSEGYCGHGIAHDGTNFWTTPGEFDTNAYTYLVKHTNWPNDVGSMADPYYVRYAYGDGTGTIATPWSSSSYITFADGPNSDGKRGRMKISYTPNPTFETVLVSMSIDDATWKKQTIYDSTGASGYYVPLGDGNVYVDDFVDDVAADAGAGGAVSLPGQITTEQGQVIIAGDGTVTLPQFATAPIAPTSGQIYHDTATNTTYIYDGTTWQPFANLTSAAITSTVATTAHASTYTDVLSLTIPDGILKVGSVISFTAFGDANGDNDGALDWRLKWNGFAGTGNNIAAASVTCNTDALSHNWFLDGSMTVRELSSTGDVISAVSVSHVGIRSSRDATIDTRSNTSIDTTGTVVVTLQTKRDVNSSALNIQQAKIEVLQ